MAEGSVKSVAEILGSVVKPMYEDAVQPAAKQIGRTLETVTKTVNIALIPIKALVWGYEQIESWLTLRLADKLRNVSDEHIVTPAPVIAGPAIEALRYAGTTSTCGNSMQTFWLPRWTRIRQHRPILAMWKC